MCEIGNTNILFDQDKKAWNKPKCFSGKDFGYFGLIQQNGPYDTPS